MKYSVRAATFLSALALLSLVRAGEPVDTSKLPPAAAKQVDFAKDIKPILENNCVKCHGPEKQKSKYRLDSRDEAVKGGKSGEAAIVPGKSEKSPFIHFVARLVPDLEMPPEGKDNQPLTKEQVALLRAWVDQGAKWE